MPLTKDELLSRLNQDKNTIDILFDETPGPALIDQVLEQKDQVLEQKDQPLLDICYDKLVETIFSTADIIGSFNETRLLWAVVLNQAIAPADARAEHIDRFSQNDVTPLIAAIKFNRVARLFDLLRLGADPNIHSQTTSPAILLAVYDNQKTIVAGLLEYQANIDVQDANRNTPLHIAVQRNNIKIVGLLLRADAQRKDPIINRYNLNRETALMIAIGKQNRTMIAMLLDHGASVDCVNQHQETPLHLLAKMGDFQEVDIQLFGIVLKKMQRNHPNLITKINQHYQSAKDIAVLKQKRHLIAMLNPFYPQQPRNPQPATVNTLSSSAISHASLFKPIAPLTPPTTYQTPLASAPKPAVIEMDFGTFKTLYDMFLKEDALRQLLDLTQTNPRNMQALRNEQAQSRFNSQHFSQVPTTEELPRTSPLEGPIYSAAALAAKENARPLPKQVTALKPSAANKSTPLQQQRATTYGSHAATPQMNACPRHPLYQSLHPLFELGNYDDFKKSLVEFDQLLQWNNDGQTPIHVAIERDRVDLVKMFKDFARNNDINQIQSSDNVSVLEMAKFFGNQEIIELLTPRNITPRPTP